MQQQMKHLMTTREWLGPADTEVPHDHAIQEQYRSQAELDTQAAGIVGQLWDKAKQNWPWLGLITVLGGVARKFYGQYKTHETVAKRFIVGIQDAKNAARENGGAISPEALNGYLTTATSLVHDPKVRAAAKDLVKTTKDSLRDVKKEIDAVRGKDS
jgi:hypothetical protein